MGERPGPEQFMAPQESRERQEAEVTRVVFEYVDKDGKPLGTAEVELEGPEVPVEHKTAKGGEPGMARKLRSFVLKGRKDGVETTLDVMELTNPHGTEVVSATRHLENYSYDDKKALAVVPPLETPLDVGVFLHELGHADQFHEERFEKIAPLYGRSVPATKGEFTMSYVGLNELLEAVAEAVPDARKLLDEEGLAQLRRLEDRRHDALERKAEFDRALTEQERMRNEELQQFLEDAMARRVDVKALFEEAAELARQESADRAASGQPRRFGAKPPFEPTEAAARLVERIADAGVRFQEEYEEDGLDKKRWRPEDVTIPAERELPAMPLSERSITTAKQAMEVLAAVRDIQAFGAELRYDTAAEELIVRFPFNDAGQPRVLALRLDVGQEEFERYAEQRGNADRVVRRLEEKNDAAYEDAVTASRGQQILIEGLAMKDVAAIPTRMMERDATRRALQWARAIRQRSGVDLLATHLAKPESQTATGGAKDQDCEGSVEAGLEREEVTAVEASILADLKKALGSYGADKMRLKPPGDEDGPGFIPIAGKERPPKES